MLLPHPANSRACTKSLGKVIRFCRKKKWDSLIGGAETETTLKRNRLTIDSIAFKPGVLRNVSTIDLSVEHFGRTLRLPVFLAPTMPP
ncbi:alpha-hydroxy-acid oxidizing protein [Phyllobacterium zundukense]|uniref:Alpha-hydroxy-acid oxidizing protein n=1 Tax=Phyllobacterium zundukense TaxID=1867719 RepID=A0ACD4CXZ4_9HYPH|nr:alpha-hydroxy-acid oxidizing protein [Phyllobacterium zundukense]